MHRYSFEKLDVWQKSIDLSELIYQVTKAYSQDEKFGLTSQLRRASISISSNIAEGSSRLSSKEKCRFYEIAYGSLMEVLSLILLSLRLHLITEVEYLEIRVLLDEVANKLNALNRSQRNN